MVGVRGTAVARPHLDSKGGMRSPLLTHTLGVFAAVVVLRLVLVLLVPIVQDETYYLAWATAPDWGYFDHPPAVAWIGATIGLSWGSPLAGRLGTMLVAALAYPFMAGLLVHAGIRERRAHLAGLLLLSFNRSEEHTSELQSLRHLVCRLLLEKKNNAAQQHTARKQSETTSGSRTLINRLRDLIGRD